MERLYLLTGAAGNLGNNVAHELVSRGALVRALVLPGDKAAKLLPKELELFEGDVLDCASLRGFFEAPPETELYVIHCAGIVSIGWNYNKRVHAVNVEGTRNVVSQCVASHVKKLVYVSSVHALPEAAARAGHHRGGRFRPGEDQRLLWKNKSGGFADCAACRAGRRA